MLLDVTSRFQVYLLFSVGQNMGNQILDQKSGWPKSLAGLALSATEHTHDNQKMKLVLFLPSPTIYVFVSHYPFNHSACCKLKLHLLNPRPG
jgi:hypothetical protein